MLKDLEKAPSTLIVLAAPSLLNEYYKDHFKDIIKFQKDLVEKVITQTSDQILIFADEPTFEKCAKDFPPQIMRKFNFSDIWIRDFSPPVEDLHFKYSTSYENDILAPVSWLSFANKTKLSFQRVDYMLDGGNVVHNGKDKLIVSRRFLEDNKITSLEEGIKILKSLFKTFHHFAIIPYDDPVLGHADGMVSFIEEDVLLMIKFDENKLLRKVRKILNKSFEGIKIIEIETIYSGQKYKGVFSAEGCYVNILTTNEALYVPIFEMKFDETVLKVIQENTKKKVVPINCKKVSILGGTVRCLTWEVKGKNAENILNWKEDDDWHD